VSNIFRELFSKSDRRSAWTERSLSGRSGRVAQPSRLRSTEFASQKLTLRCCVAYSRKLLELDVGCSSFAAATADRLALRVSELKRPHLRATSSLLLARSLGQTRSHLRLARAHVCIADDAVGVYVGSEIGGTNGRGDLAFDRSDIGVTDRSIGRCVAKQHAHRH
jgi:hypothetical protein